MSTPAGCPVFSMPPLWKWTSDNGIFLALIFITCGVLLLWAGGKHFVASMCLIAGMAATTIMLCVLFAFILPNSTPQYMVWCTVFFCMGIGAGMSYGVWHWPKAGIITIGTVVGIFWGTIFFTLFLSTYTGDATLIGDEEGIITPQTSITVDGKSQTVLEVISGDQETWWFTIIIFGAVFAAIHAMWIEFACIYGT